ncbi:hypothetical protein [Streptomyces sp. NBC_01361]|uniref:hypothetical protein n=1 Tax=Streptomyces sp. NBC_01361 TaxID=2903838 RepID=UPI002E376449|nr:hypothetical protein [Streptomyces sp. NBC_01361]
MGAPNARHDVPAAGNGAPSIPLPARSPAGGIVLDRWPRARPVLDRLALARSMSPCARRRRPTASSMAIPPAAHQGASIAANRAATSLTGAGPQGPNGASMRVMLLRPR